MLIKLQNGQPTGAPLVDANFKQLFPNISFPQDLRPSDVEPLGYGLYDFSSPPAPGKYQKVAERPPVRNSSGIWIQAWALEPMSSTEQQQEDVRKGLEVRAQRNGMLTRSDWTQIPDAPVNKQAWLQYRQALREVPTQAGFPWTVSWPVKPE